MTKKEILELANGLYDEALLAQTYLTFIKQFNIFKTIEKYNNEISMSPCFYRISYEAWIRALIMELAKMYDGDKKYNTLKILKEELKQLSPQHDFCGMLYIPKDGIDWICLPVDKKDLVLINKKYSAIYTLCDIEEDCEIPIQIPYDECTSFFNQKWCSINPQRKNLREQRNQVFAHNGYEINFDFIKINEQYPLSYADVETLIDYAMRLTRFVIGMLTDISKPTQYSNQNDWEATLIAVREGNIRISEQLSKSNF